MGERMRRLLSGSLAGLGLAMLLAAPVAAGSEPTELRRFERGHLASAGGGECQGDERRQTCTETQVSIFDGRRGGSEPEFRFAGEEVCVFRFKSTFNPRTGRILSDTFEQGCARNRQSLDVDFGERLRQASVAGTIKLQRLRCVHSGEEPSCESDERRVALDLYWDGQGPITERFIYFRETRKNCESTFTGTQRSRDASVSGQIGAKPVGLGGSIVRHDLQETRVCT